MKNSAVYFGLIGLALLSSPGEAGQFFVLNVSYEMFLRPSDVTILVTSTNQYLGSVDSNDNNWFVQTLLNHTDGTGGLYDWSNPEFYGPGLNGDVVYGGMSVSCGNGCGADGEIWRPLWGSGVPLNYVGRGGAVIYHQFSPDIDVLDGDVRSVPFTFEAVECGGAAASATTAVQVLHVAGPKLSYSPSTGWTQPQDSVEGEPYLVEDWALVEVGLESKVLDSSYSGFARHMRTSFSSQMVAEEANAGTPSQVLVIDYPVHPHNSRHVDPPKVILKNRKPATSFQGRAVVRIDFAEEGHIHRIDLLNDLGVDGSLLLPHLRRQFDLEKISDSSHRAIAFVILDVGDELAIADSFVYTPTCCCPAAWPFCPG